MADSQTYYDSDLTGAELDAALRKIPQMEASVAAAADSATLSKSWAQGGTGARAGEDANNAKYWCGKAQQAAQQALGFRTFFSAISPDANGDLDPSRPMTSPTAATVTVKSTGDRIQSVQVNGFTTQAGTGTPSQANVRAISAGGIKLVQFVADNSTQFNYSAGNQDGATVGISGTSVAVGTAMYCSIAAQSSVGTLTPHVWRLSNGSIGLFIPQKILSPYGFDGTAQTASSSVLSFFGDKAEKGEAVKFWYVRADESQATGLYIPNEIQGHEYRCQCLKLTAPLCNGDYVQTSVPSGCDQTITLDGTSVTVIASGSNYVATAENAVAGGAVYAEDLAYLTLAAGQIVIPATSFPSSVTSAQTANAWLQSNPQKVWYQSTVYAKQNDIPVQLETHANGVQTADGTNVLFAQGTNGYTVSLPGASDGAVLCNCFSGLTTASGSVTVPTSQFPSNVTDLDSANTWVQSNPVTILYPLSAPAVYAHDAVDIVAVPYAEADEAAANQLVSTPSTLPYIDSSDVPMLLSDEEQAAEGSLEQSMSLAATLSSTTPVAGTYDVNSQSGATVAVSLKPFQDGGDAATLGGASPSQYQMPIGFIFQWLPVSGQSIDLTTPENVAAYFGYGVWQNVASGQFLIGQGSGYAAGSTGGEATHTLTKAEVPEFYNVVYGGSGGSSTCLASSAVYTAGSYSGIVQNVPLNNGGGGAHNNMPPYLAVYTWQRIA